MNKEALIKRIERLRDFAITDYGKGRNEALTSAIDVIRDFEDPAQVDEELEAARQKFPVGSWFTANNNGSTIYKVKEVVRTSDFDIKILADNKCYYYALESTPFTFPSEPEWHPMSEAPDCPGNYKVKHGLYIIDAHYYKVMHQWFVHGVPVTFPTTAQWRAV